MNKLLFPRVFDGALTPTSGRSTTGETPLMSSDSFWSGISQAETPRLVNSPVTSHVCKWVDQQSRRARVLGKWFFYGNLSLFWRRAWVSRCWILAFVVNVITVITLFLDFSCESNMVVCAGVCWYNTYIIEKFQTLLLWNWCNTRRILTRKVYPYYCRSSTYNLLIIFEYWKFCIYLPSKQIKFYSNFWIHHNVFQFKGTHPALLTKT